MNKFAIIIYQAVPPAGFPGLFNSAALFQIPAILFANAVVP
jgi:hypothetical protein